MKKIIIFLLIVLLILGAWRVWAKACDLNTVQSSLRNALYSFYVNPSASVLTPAELRDLLAFYLDAASRQGSPNCNLRGGETNLKVQDILDKTAAVRTTIPTCNDGTEYGLCSSQKPWYCFNGKLQERCSDCGCNSGSCSPLGKCQ